MRYQPVHCTIVAMDVVSSGGRDDQLLLRMRSDLRRIVTEALAGQGLDPTSIDRTDLGDGVRLIVPATTTPAVFLDPFLPNLAAMLREHHKSAADRARLRLRVAVHIGLLHRDDGVWAGGPLVLCARLLDAAALRRVMAAADELDLAVLVSQDVYDSVVRHGYGLDPATYRPVRLHEKETRAAAWLHVPGYRAPPRFHSWLRLRRLARSRALRAALRGSPLRIRARPLALYALAAFGLVAAGWFGTQAFVGSLGAPPAALLVLVAAACLAWGALRAREPTRLTRDLGQPEVRISVRVGDVFDEDAHLVIGFADTFDTSGKVISGASLQGQLVDRRYDGDTQRLDRELVAALARHTPTAVEKREAKRWGKLSHYPLGTVAVLGPPNRRLFAVAYSRMGNDLVSVSSVDDLWQALSRLWDAVYEHGERRDVAMPVIGTGLARLDQHNAQNLIEMIVLSFVARSRRSPVTRELRVMIRPADMKRVSMRKLRAFIHQL